MRPTTYYIKDYLLVHACSVARQIQKRSLYCCSASIPLQDETETEVLGCVFEEDVYPRRLVQLLGYKVEAKLKWLSGFVLYLEEYLWRTIGGHDVCQSMETILKCKW